MTYKLILLRHGQSDWNAKDLFTGWVDVPLSEQGRREAIAGGKLLKEKNVLPDIVHTSVLRRAVETANLALDEADRDWIPVRRDWRLNERHYGALQGLNKSQTRQKYGDEKYWAWRRSYDVRPPPIEPGSQYAQDGDPRYGKDVPIPKCECLKDVVARMVPYFDEVIVPDLKAGRAVLLAAHGNSLRALVKHLDGISDADIAALNLPTGVPLLYELDDQFRPITKGGTYLDPEAAEKSIAEVKAQGQGK